MEVTGAIVLHAATLPTFRTLYLCLDVLLDLLGDDLALDACQQRLGICQAQSQIIQAF
jgi:hypothetical protein